MDWFDHPLPLACGAAVLHFLWQGTLIGFAAWALLRVQPQERPDRRYAIACAALGLCVLCFGVTALLAARSAAPLDVHVRPGLAAFAGPAIASPRPWNAAQLAGLFWAAGALAMLLRFAAQAGRARRLRTLQVSAPSRAWRAAFQDLKRLVGVAPGVRLLASGACRVPMVVGWWQPVVLVPASAFTGLGTDQLRSLLIHELAHLRRFDHLANALQSCVEIVLFFHPAVWLLSGLARQERECCCDAIAIHHIADPRTLARALADIAALGLQQPVPQTQLAANGGPLMQRIQRILASDSRPQDRRRGTVPLGLGLTMASLLVIGGGTAALAAPDATQDVPVSDSKPVREPAALALPVRRPLPASNSAKDAAKTHHHQVQADLERIQSELEALVAAGKLKPAEAKLKFAKVRVQLLETLLAAEHDRRALEDMERVRADRQAAALAGPGSGANAGPSSADARRDAILQELDMVNATGRDLQIQIAAGKLSAEQAKAKLEAISAQAVVLTDLKDRLEAQRIKEDQWRKRLALLEADRRSVEQELRMSAVNHTQALEHAQALTAELQRMHGSKGSASARAELEAQRGAAASRPQSLADQLRKVELATAAGKLSKEQAIASLQSIRQSMRDMENVLKEQLAEEKRAEYLEAKRLLEESR